MPGLELKWPVTSRWVLKPFGHYGWGKELKGEDEAWIYSAGIHSVFDLKDHIAGLKLLNGLQWCGYTPKSGITDRFARLITGLEGLYPMGDLTFQSHRLYLRPHIAHFWYFNDIDFQLFTEEASEINQELEMAFAVGPAEPFRLWLIEIDRIGLAYRVGNHLQGIRLFASSIFD